MALSFNYRERAELLGAFMLDLGIEHNPKQLLDVMCCIDVRTFEAYLNDVNITIRRTNQSRTIIASTVNDDREWVRAKVELSWKRLKELSNSRT